MISIRAFIIAVSLLLAGCAATPPDPSVPAQPEIRCIGVTVDVCRAMLTVVEASYPADLAAASLIIVADTCPPNAECDRQFQFDAVVALVPAAGGPPLLLSVLGRDRPDQVAPWEGPLPQHIAALLANP